MIFCFADEWIEVNLDKGAERGDGEDEKWREDKWRLSKENGINVKCSITDVERRELERDKVSNFGWEWRKQSVLLMLPFIQLKF